MAEIKIEVINSVLSSVALTDGSLLSEFTIGKFKFQKFESIFSLMFEISEIFFFSHLLMQDLSLGIKL